MHSELIDRYLSFISTLFIFVNFHPKLFVHFLEENNCPISVLECSSLIFVKVSLLSYLLLDGGCCGGMKVDNLSMLFRPHMAEGSRWRSVFARYMRPCRLCWSQFWYAVELSWSHIWTYRRSRHSSLSMCNPLEAEVIAQN